MANILREGAQYGDFLMKEPNGFEYQSLGKAKDKWGKVSNLEKGMGPENNRAGDQEMRRDSLNKRPWVP